MPEPTLFDAVSSAIESDGHETGASHEDTAVDESGAADSADLVEEGSDQDVGGHSEGDDQGGEQGSDDAEGAESDDEGQEGDEAGAQRGPDGKFVKKGAEPEKPGEKPADKAAAKKPDHVNDPIPKDLKPGTQERMRYLVNETKKLTAERERIQGDFNYMIEGIKATGTSPDQYREVLSFMALFNSGDVKQQEQALELIESLADRLATSLGKDRTITDPLAAHADLKAEVQAGKLTAERAKEIARHRNQGAFRQEITSAARTEQEQAQTAQREKEQARLDLNDLETQLSRTDREYAAIKAQLLPALKPIFATLPARQWKEAFVQAYSNVKATRQAAAAARTRQPGSQPMRGGRSVGGGGGGQGGGDMKSQPGSMLDAVSAALDSM